MINRLGNVIYWSGCLFAAFWAFAAYSSAPDREIYIFVAILAVLISWAIRYILTGRKTIIP